MFPGKKCLNMSQNSDIEFGFMNVALVLFVAARLMAAPPQSAAPASAVYSAAQADRGRIVIESHCSSCHGDDLTGLEGPALVGNAFMLKWEQGNLAALFRKIRDTMPTGAVTSVSEDEKIDAVAYLLQQNGFAEGATELTKDIDALARIPMSRTSGPAALRTGSLVQVVGCLSQGEGNAWMLTHATEPQPAAATAAATATATEAPTQNPPGGDASGSGTVRLLSVFPDPSAHKGHKMKAGGLLVKDAAGLSVNVMSLEMIGSSCGE
jgi:mono/diheme cytochrome c family protein